MKLILPKNLTFFAVLAISQLSAAGPDEQASVGLIANPTATQELNSHLVDSGQDAADLDSSLEIVYDPRTLVVTSEDLRMAAEKLARLNAATIADESSRSALGTEYVIPIGPSRLELLQNLSTLAPTDVNLFMAKKQRFMETWISSWLKWLRIPKKVHNGILRAMNDQFFESAKMLARANKFGFQARLTFSMGFGLGQKLAEKFKGTALGKRLPNLEGFALLTSTGVQLTRSSANGRAKWALEFYGAFARQVEIGNFGLALVSAGVLAGPVIGVDEDENGDSIRTYDLNHPGPIGFVQRADDHLSLMGPAPLMDVAVPPFVGGLFFYRLREKSMRLARLQWRASTASADQLFCAKVLHPAN